MHTCYASYPYYSYYTCYTCTLLARYLHVFRERKQVQAKAATAQAVEEEIRFAGNASQVDAHPILTLSL